MREFQRVHCVEKHVSSNGKPPQIIAHFLKYPQREEIMSNARKLEGKKFGISLDLSSEIFERRKKKMKQFKQAKKDGKIAFLVGWSRINCLLMLLRCKNITKII